MSLFNFYSNQFSSSNPSSSSSNTFSSSSNTFSSSSKLLNDSYRYYIRGGNDEFIDAFDELGKIFNRKNNGGFGGLIDFYHKELLKYRHNVIFQSYTCQDIFIIESDLAKKWTCHDAFSGLYEIRKHEISYFAACVKIFRRILAKDIKISLCVLIVLFSTTVSNFIPLFFTKYVFNIQNLSKYNFFFFFKL